MEEPEWPQIFGEISPESGEWNEECLHYVGEGGRERAFMPLTHSSVLSKCTLHLMCMVTGLPFMMFTKILDF